MATQSKFDPRLLIGDLSISSPSHQSRAASNPKESNSDPPPPRRGRPKGSKDGPRLPDAPKRGRPAVERSTEHIDGLSKGKDRRSGE